MDSRTQWQAKLHAGSTRCSRPPPRSDAQVRQRIADGVDDLNELGMGLFEALDRRRKPFKRQLQQVRVLLFTRGFMGREFSEARDALRVFLVSLRQRGDLRLQRGEQLQQVALALVRDRIGALYPGF